MAAFEPQTWIGTAFTEAPLLAYAGRRGLRAALTPQIAAAVAATTAPATTSIP